MRKHIVIVVCLIVSFSILGAYGFYKTNKVKKQRNQDNVLDATSRTIIPKGGLVYINDKAGYKIIFPENWKDRYVITEYDSGEICIGFYGESKTSQTAFKESFGRYGLDLGWIVDYVPDEGSRVIGKIAETEDVEYFLTTPRGGTYVPELEYTINDSIIDENEKLLASKDFKNAVNMRDDLYNINFKVEILR